MRSLLAISVLALGLVVACTSCQGTSAASIQPTRALPAPAPSRTPYPFTPVPLEPLPAYPTPAGSDYSRSFFPAQDLPEGATPPVPEATQLDYAYYLVGQALIGRYAIRQWQDPRLGSGIFTISVGEEVLARAECHRLEVRHAGQDITGEGHPDVVVDLRYGGESYISTSTQVYDLGPVLTKVLDSPIVATDPTYEVPCPPAGVFSDLDGDGSAEFVTCDDAPRWGYYGAANINPYAEHRRLVVMAILQYQPGHGYGPAGPRFSWAYGPNIASYTAKAEEQAAQDPAGGSGYSPVALVALAFNDLYSGQPGKAWTDLDRLHDGPDTVLVWSEILRQASDRPFYVAGGSLPDVPVPDYYSLALRLGCETRRDCSGAPAAGQPTCEPVDWLAEQFLLGQSAPIGLLEEGQRPCDAGVAVRSLAWLEYQLTRAGNLESGEYLRVSSAGCTDTCGVVVYRREGAGDEITVGYLNLDAAGEFPGDIVRVDVEGSESGRWRLRGDLTWEAVLP